MKKIVITFVLLALSLAARGQVIVAEPSSFDLEYNQNWIQCSFYNTSGASLPQGIANSIVTNFTNQLRSQGYPNAHVSAGGDGYTSGGVEIQLGQNNTSSSDKGFTLSGYFTIHIIHRKAPPVTAGTLSPATQTVASGTRPNISHTGASGGSINWYYKPSTSSTWSASPSLPALTNTGTSNVTYQIKARVTNPIESRETNTVSVTVVPGKPISPSADQNYIIKNTFISSLGTASVVTSALAMSDITYYDGLGRPVQSTLSAASPQKEDQVTLIEYDAYGRQSKNWLPGVTAADNNGRFVEATALRQFAVNANRNDSRPFVETVYAASPLDEPVAQHKPGVEYQSRPVTTSAQVNTTADAVLKLEMNGNGFRATNYYPAGSLFKILTVNEEGLQTIIFTDKAGRTLLQRSSDGVNTKFDTYSVYDDRGLLRWVISPEGAASLTATGSWALTSTLAVRFSYMYRYDNRDRIITKRLPGADSVVMRYDGADRMIASQDGNGRAGGYWILYEYDGLDRLTKQVRSSNLTVDSGDTPLLVYTYDAYPAGTSLAKLTSIGGITVSIDDRPVRLKGLKTAETVAVLGGTTGQTIERRFYYDSRGRLTQTVERNHLGYTSRYTTQYDFIGNVVASHESHQTASGTTHNVLTTSTYDHRGRRLTTATQLNNSAPATVRHGYNKLGRLEEKWLGSLPYEAYYTYDVRGWLNTQSGNFYGARFYYVDEAAGKYAGNLTKWTWNYYDFGYMVPANYYALNYDKFNRLISAEHWYTDSTPAGFAEKGITYDRNGNIKTLLRTAGGSTLDNFTYTYDGNRLTALSGVTGTYTYDPNGNLTNDPRKDLQFEYNSLNLPERVTAGASVRARYQWAADGTKLQVRDAAGANGYDYLGSLTLARTNNTPVPEVSFDDGVIRGGQITYFERDHLGSVRASISAGGALLGRNDYYAFGGRHPGGGPLDPNNRLKFNGKEDQVTGALGLLDYGARMYDPTLARWQNVDPLAEKYLDVSGYAFTGNNPIMHVDPNGMWFTEAAWEMIEELEGDIDSEYGRNLVRIEDLQARMSAGGLSDRQTERFMHQVDNLNAANARLDVVRGEIATLAASNQGYDVRIDDSHNTTNMYQGTSEFNFETGVFDMTIPSGGGMHFLAHELKHAYQFEVGEFSTDIERMPVFYDQHDEVAAYERGAMFGGPRHTINNLSDIYRNRPIGPIDASNHPNIRHLWNYPANLQGIANSRHAAFRVNGVTYYRQKR